MESKPKPKRPINPALRDLMAQALRDAEMNQEELIRKSGLGRGPIGDIVRGQVQRLAPQQANTLVTVLPLSMEQLMTAVGYNFGPRPARTPTLLRQMLEEIRGADYPVVEVVVQGLLAVQELLAAQENPPRRGRQ